MEITELRFHFFIVLWFLFLSFEVHDTRTYDESRLHCH